MYTYWKNGGTYQPAKNDSLLCQPRAHHGTPCLEPPRLKCPGVVFFPELDRRELPIYMLLTRIVRPAVPGDLVCTVHRLRFSYLIVDFCKFIFILTLTAHLPFDQKTMSIGLSALRLRILLAAGFWTQVHRWQYLKKWLTLFLQTR